MNKYTGDGPSPNEPAETSEALQDRVRQAIENASTQDLLAIIRLHHAIQTDMKIAVASSKTTRSRRPH